MSNQNKDWYLPLLIIQPKVCKKSVMIQK